MAVPIYVQAPTRNPVEAMAARAPRMNGATRLRCIEPFPMEELKQGIPGVDGLIQKTVQDVPVSFFEGLDRNDILFVDSTHVSKIGSGVNYVVFDIFLPDEYPRDWVLDQHLFWNEQHLILAFLLFNNAFEVLFSCRCFGERESDKFRRVYPYLPAYGGCSLWIRRTA
jgi:hypothetical protein